MSTVVCVCTCQRSFIQVKLPLSFRTLDIILSCCLFAKIVLFSKSDSDGECWPQSQILGPWERLMMPTWHQFLWRQKDLCLVWKMISKIYLLLPAFISPMGLRCAEGNHCCSLLDISHRKNFFSTERKPIAVKPVQRSVFRSFSAWKRNFHITFHSQMKSM